MQTGAQRDGHERVPGRIEVDFVEPMAVTVEGAQGRRVFVGVETELHGFRLAERGAECAQPIFRPARPLARDRLTQHGIAAEKIIGLERRRLVADLEHEPGLLRPRLWHRPGQGNSATCSSPMASG